MAVMMLFVPLTVRAQSEPVSAKQVLAHDPEELAFKLKDMSEAGQDNAARMWATAKRLETENMLAASSVQTVLRLGYWRNVLDRWQDLWLELQSLESGGGSMWGHFSARNDATLEEFLAANAQGLTAESADAGEKVSLDVLEQATNHIAKAKTLAKELDRDIDQASKDLLNKMDEAQSELRFSLSTIRDAKTRKTVNQWLLEKANRSY